MFALVIIIQGVQEGLTGMEGHGDYAAKLNAALCL
jgi:hypothetical protein